MESGYVLPEQTEFAKLKINYTMMGKRNLLEMVETGTVSGWDDPRMPTLAGMRRRGFTPASIRNFCESVGQQDRQLMRKDWPVALPVPYPEIPR